MEDAHLARVDFKENMSLFAVFDGHGGAVISNYVATTFLEVLVAQPAFLAEDYQQALHDAFLQLDDNIKNNLATSTNR